MKILVLDNYDSFTYNLVQYLKELHDGEIEVFRNDKISVADVAVYDAIVLSPGPGLPGMAGIMPELIYKYAPSKPIFGVCLGMQAIGEAFGRQLRNLDQVYHGIATDIDVIVPDDAIFRDLPNRIEVGRYHSWVVDRANVRDDLLVTAVDDLHKIMALRHRHYPTWGVQFHPESVMTPDGKKMLQNFLDAARSYYLTKEDVATKATETVSSPSRQNS